MECVKGGVCCSPAVHQFCSVKKSELTLGGGSIFVQRIFCGQHILHGMSVNIPGVTQLLPFIQIHFETVSCVHFCILNLFCSTLEVDLTFSLAIPFPVVPSLPSPMANHPNFHTAVPPQSLFQHIKWNLAVSS